MAEYTLAEMLERNLSSNQGQICYATPRRRLTCLWCLKATWMAAMRNLRDGNRATTTRRWVCLGCGRVHYKSRAAIAFLPAIDE